MIYLLTAIGLSPGGRSKVHIYTQTIHRTIRNKQYIEQHNNHSATQQCRLQSDARNGKSKGPTVKRVTRLIIIYQETIEGNHLQIFTTEISHAFRTPYQLTSFNKHVDCKNTLLW